MYSHFIILLPPRLVISGSNISSASSGTGLSANMSEGGSGSGGGSGGRSSPQGGSRSGSGSATPTRPGTYMLEYKIKSSHKDTIQLLIVDFNDTYLLFTFYYRRE